jgi:hypothetical protein
MVCVKQLQSKSFDINAYGVKAYICCAVSDVATPKDANAKPNCMCKELVIVSNNPYDQHLIDLLEG